MHTVPPLRPWCVGGQSIVPWCTQTLAATGWAIGLTHGPRPAADGVLHARFRDWDAPAAWFDHDHAADPLWQAAQAQGVGTGTASDGYALASPGASLLMATWPAADGGTNKSRWYAVLVREVGSWSEAEQRHVRLALRRVQAAWDHPLEAGLGRWLLGEGGRVIHADAQTQAGWVTPDAPPPAWASQVHEVIRQRWDAATGQRVYDLAFERSDRPGVSSDRTPGEPPAAPDAEWVRLHHRPAVHGLGRFDYIETRPLDASDAPPVGVVDDLRVGTALGYLADHYAESPGLKDVAAVAECSPFHFHRLFSRVVGVSPKHYLLRTQLQMAKWRLRTGNLPVGDVAASAGFASHGHFTATFHRVVGESPTDYRDRHAQNVVG